jgi:peptidoglycan hydrolase-like protein with peptidoglycan-binding domain
MGSRWNWEEASEGEADLESLAVEAEGPTTGRSGARGGRWIRKGSTLILLGVGRGHPGPRPGEFEEELFETGQPTLRRGSRGEAVKELQRRLQAAGFNPGAIDGIFGQGTDSAVRAFQRARGLTADGIVGPNTWAKLGASGPTGPVTPQPTADRWVLPANVRAAGEAQLVRYDGAPAWQGGRNCTGQFTAGAAALRRFIQANFAGVTSIGGYNCRQNTANLAETSVHGTGRALDIMIPRVGNRANSAVGDPIANWLVSNAAAIGVQYIIWNRVSWNGSRTRPKERAYTGPNPHTDHIHAELNHDGANRRTPWFATQP